MFYYVNESKSFGKFQIMTYMVYIEGKNPPKKEHKTLAEAEKEALRILNEYKLYQIPGLGIDKPQYIKASILEVKSIVMDTYNVTKERTIVPCNEQNKPQKNGDMS